VEPSLVAICVAASVASAISVAASASLGHRRRA